MMMIASLAIYQIFFMDSTISFNVMLVHQPHLDKYGLGIKAAYSSVMEEEGIPYHWQTRKNILRFSPSAILRNNPVIIFPDEITQKIPKEFAMWVKEYIALGGNVLIVFDSGVCTKTGVYREEAVFSSFLGLNYITYKKYERNAYQLGHIQFPNKEIASYFQIPPGKMSDNLTVSGYKYGNLDYPVAKVEIDEDYNDFEVFANTNYLDGTVEPNMILKHLGDGKVFFVNLPLGYLKAFGSDDLMLRSTIITFLFRIVKFPHMVSKPFNKGGLVLNWHLDHYKERKNFDLMVKNNLIRKNINQSFQITAGDFLHKPGDNKGFDAGGKGKKTIRKLINYGSIGSHGGWAHEWFANNLENGTFSETDIEWNIKRNADLLSNIVGYKITEFSAPRGYHKQPLMTEIIERNGFTSYYYTGDSGSQPNRTFYNGELVSESVIAFPIMPIFKWASVQELGNYNIEPQFYENWLMRTLDYIVEYKTTVLIYSHFYDFVNYPQYMKPFNVFLDKLQEYQKKDLLQVNSMNYFAEYLVRFLKTECNFEIRDEKFRIDISNPEGLKGFSIALPKQLCRRPAGYGFVLDSDEDYYYIIINKDMNEKLFVFPLR